jgi:pseudouridine kinase
VQRIAVSLGQRGVMISEAGRPALRLPAPRVAVVIDVTGAGDAFAAGVCAGLWHDEGWEAACRRGLALAGSVLQSTASTL